jgi:hypothetical protein
MDLQDTELYDTEIKIYQSFWKNLLLIMGCILFVVGGGYIISGPSRIVTRIIGGWLCVVFFGGGGLFLCVTVLLNSVRHIPYLIIYKDRVELYVLLKANYDTIYFADVQRFRLIKIGYSKQVAIDYKATFLSKKIKSSSTILRRLMLFNMQVVGAVESFAISNLTMKGKEIYRLLEEHLKRNRSEECNCI